MPQEQILPAGDEKPEARYTFLRVFCVILFLAYTARLFTMQVLQGSSYRSMARDTARRTATVPAQRGEIYDRSFSAPLAWNEASFSISITPAEVPPGRLAETIGKIARITGVPKEQIERKVPAQLAYLYQPVEAVSGVPFAAIAALAEQADALPGVSWEAKPVREYAEDLGSLSHIVGYIGDITRDELLLRYDKGYQQGDLIGKDGIEKQYEELLRGEDGRETRVVDSRGRRISGGGGRILPKTGRNLVLTIDRGIQTLAEKALGERSGAAVVLRPATGEILAMVSYPWVDSRAFLHGQTSEEFARVLDDPDKPLLNRAVQSSYPPASTFKIVVTTGILAEGSFPQEQTVNCPGEINFGGRTWRCWILRPGHGRLNLQRAVADSCDIYFWTVARDTLGAERIIHYARDFGFGAPTGIDLPSESSGFVPTPQWKEQNIHEKWVPGDTMNMAIGQSYTLATPLQLADMTAMVVNGGVIYQPHLLKEVRDPDSGALEQVVVPKVLRRSDVPEAVFEEVRKDMRSVVTGGTVRYTGLNSRLVEIAGKTGTAEVGQPDRWHSWFVAYAPFRTDRPEDRVVVSVIVEASNQWEWWGTYAAAIILQGIFAHQTYEEAARSMRVPASAPASGRRE
jgi:penicillin-binding protein 2